MRTDELFVNGDELWGYDNFGKPVFIRRLTPDEIYQIEQEQAQMNPGYGGRGYPPQPTMASRAPRGPSRSMSMGSGRLNRAPSYGGGAPTITTTSRFNQGTNTITSTTTTTSRFNKGINSSNDPSIDLSNLTQYLYKPKGPKRERVHKKEIKTSYSAIYKVEDLLGLGNPGDILSLFINKPLDDDTIIKLGVEERLSDKSPIAGIGNMGIEVTINKFYTKCLAYGSPNWDFTIVDYDNIKSNPKALENLEVNMKDLAEYYKAFNKFLPEVGHRNIPLGVRVLYAEKDLEQELHASDISANVPIPENSILKEYIDSLKLENFYIVTSLCVYSVKGNSTISVIFYNEKVTL
jgi:hypothetical protein